MSHDRSVSASGAELVPETVWGFELPAIRFGRGAIEELAAQLRGLGVEQPARGVVVTDGTLVGEGHADRVCEQLSAFDVDVYDGAEREPSVASVGDCVSFVRDRTGDGGYDFYVGLGGGSCMDTAKATRAVVANGGHPLDYVAEPTGAGDPVEESGPPLVLLPTTAGTGAEISPVAILSVEDAGVKEGISSDGIRADAAVLDPALTVSLPPDLTAETAMDALGHAMEGYTTHRYDALLRADPDERPVYAGRTRLTELLSEEAVRLVAGSVRRAVHNGDDLEARSNVLKGALFGAIAGLTAGASLCHAMAYPVGNRYHTHHGETVAALTPASTIRYNAASDPARFAHLAELFGVDTGGMADREAADALGEQYVRLQRDLGVLPSGLADLAGIGEDDVDWLAERTVETQKRLLRCNPRPVTEADVREVFLDALANW